MMTEREFKSVGRISSMEGAVDTSNCRRYDVKLKVEFSCSSDEMANLVDIAQQCDWVPLTIDRREFAFGRLRLLGVV